VIKYEPLQKAIQQFRTEKERPEYIVYECQYLKDLSIDLEFGMHKFDWAITGKEKPKPLIPESRKGIMLYGYPGYMRELGFYGFIICGPRWKMYNYVNERRFFFTKC